MEGCQTYKLSDDVVYRIVNNELVVIEVSSGTFFHFSEESRGFFDYLQKPRALSSLALTAESQERAIFDMLVEKKLVVPCEEPAENDATEKFFAPKFLRIGEERLDQARFLY